MQQFRATCLALTCLTAIGCSNKAASPANSYVLRLPASTAEDPDVKAAYSQLPEISVQVVTTGGASIPNLINLQAGKIDVGISLADVAYLASIGQLDKTSGPFTRILAGGRREGSLATPQSWVRLFFSWFPLLVVYGCVAVCRQEFPVYSFLIDIR